MLWNQLNKETREHHVTCVELFYRLHCLAPTANICEDIICHALLDPDKVSPPPCWAALLCVPEADSDTPGPSRPGLSGLLIHQQSPSRAPGLEDLWDLAPPPLDNVVCVLRREGHRETRASCPAGLRRLLGCWQKEAAAGARCPRDLLSVAVQPVP